MKVDERAIVKGLSKVFSSIDTARLLLEKLEERSCAVLKGKADAAVAVQADIRSLNAACKNIAEGFEIAGQSSQPPSTEGEVDMHPDAVYARQWMAARRHN